MRIIIFLLLTFNLVLAMKHNKENLVTIITSDEIEYTIPEKYFMKSTIYRNMIEDCPNKATPIYLPNIHSAELPLVLQFLKNNYALEDEKTTMVQKKVALNEFKTDLATQKKLYTILCAANFLQIEQLLEKCMQIWAEAKYASTKEYPLPTELDMSIAQRMHFFKTLINQVPSWVAKDLTKRNIPLLQHRLNLQHASVWCNALSRDGKLLAAGHDNGVVAIYNQENKTVNALQSNGSPITSLQFNSDDSQILFSGYRSPIVIWDVGQSKTLDIYQSEACRAFTFKSIPEYSLLIADGFSHEICCWNPKKQEPKPELLPAHTQDITALDSTENGFLFSSASMDGEAHIWNTENKKCITRFKHKDGVLSTGFNYSGNKFICGLSNGDIFLYDLTKEKCILKKTHHADCIWSVLFTDKQDTLLCSGGKDTLIKLLDTRSSEVIQEFSDHTRSVQCMATNPESNMLYSGSHDKNLLVWDLRKLIEPIKRIQQDLSHNTFIEQALFMGSAYYAEKPLGSHGAELLSNFSPETQRILTDNILKKNT